MRRYIIIFVLIAVMGLTTSALLLAQEDTTPTPAPTDINAEELQQNLVEMQSLATEAARSAVDAADSAQLAQLSADNAQTAIVDAENAVNLASNMFGLFEAMSGAIGLVVPFLAIAAGLLGFRRLESAQNELKEARERFERDMASREKEFDLLRVQLSESVQQQRDSAANASLALSLLPLGERQYRAQDYQGALDTYHRALALDPNNPIIHYRIGYVYTQSGELGKAKEQMEESLRLDPKLAPSRAALGYIYRRMGDKLHQGTERDIIYNLAEQNFLQALKDSPRLMDEDGEAWWGALGGLYRRRGQTDQAIYAYERGTAVTPQSSYPFSNLALLYAETHNRERMKETYKRVERLAFGEVQSDATNYWAYADLITSRMAIGKTKEAWDILDTALETAPADSPYTLESLMDTLNRLKGALNKDEAAAIDEVIAYIEKFIVNRAARRLEAEKIDEMTGTIGATTPEDPKATEDTDETNES